MQGLGWSVSIGEKVSMGGGPTSAAGAANDIPEECLAERFFDVGEVVP